MSENNKSSSSYFRDKISTVDEQGRRVWVFPKKPSGKLTNYRHLVAIVLYLFFFIAPFLRVEGDPLILLNILERKFILFGVVFWPQDFHLIVLSLITLIVFIVLFTVVYGRIFCGWLCPQTIFMEFVFRQIEYWIEGDSTAQRRLAKQDWNLEKIWKKSAKSSVFILIAFLISNAIFMYIFGSDHVLSMWSGLVFSSKLFFAILILTGIVYFIFGFFREQVCLIACPYGRLQGVLLDQQSVIVAYDYLRGEPRGPLKNKSQTPSSGDCVDCSACVQVCPTNIDIRNGTQLECINCTACIDACNRVMVKNSLPKGLIRFDSEKGIREGVRKLATPRSIAYTAVLAILLAVVFSLFIFRNDVETTILRQKGSLYQEYGTDAYSNIYQIDLVNKYREDLPIRLELISPKGEIKLMGKDLFIPGGEKIQERFLIVLKKSTLTQSKNEVLIGVYSESRLIDEYRVTFVGPNSLDQ
jgi:cytochrome c oxidase accessory protein FixG